MVEDMDRSLSKFLYEYLPGNTFNHANIQVSGKVTSVSSLYRDGEEETLDAPNSYVIKRVKQHFYRWPNSEELLSDDLYANVDIVVPGYAQYHTYPLTFECPNSDCGMFLRFRREEEREVHERDPEELFTCDFCGTSISVTDQLPFVGICECGEISQLWCPTHEHNDQDLNMRLARPTTRMSDWEWQCVHPNCGHTLSFMATPVECPDPSCPNEDLKITNHTDSGVFYPQTENFINLQEDLGNLDNTQYRVKVISDYVLEDQANKPTEAEIKEKAAEILGGAQAFIQADEEEEERARQEARAALTADRQEHRQKIAAWLDSHPEYDEEEKVGLAEECYEYLSLTRAKGYEPSNEFRVISYSEMASSPSETHLDEPTINHYTSLRDHLNIDRIHLIEDIPITTVTYGYTRVSSEADSTAGNQNSASGSAVDQEELEPEEADTNEDELPDEDEPEKDAEEDVEVQLNPFTTRKDPYPTFYAQENRAEGVLIELDEQTVLDWLEANGVISEEKRPTADQARMWFVNSVLQPDRYESLQDLETGQHSEQDNVVAISRHVYTLLNSFAHAFMNTVAVLSGVQRESLVERIMPHTLSFLVYKRPDTDQAFGTILSLFEERFDEFVTQFEEQESCPLNRVCFNDENGACEHCLYLPAMSTENTNHNLSRATLFGGQFDDGIIGEPDAEIEGIL